MSEVSGKIGSKGEIYPPIRIRKSLGFVPNTRIKFIISPNGDLIIRKIRSIRDILNTPHIASVSIEEVERISEEMQRKGIADA